MQALSSPTTSNSPLHLPSLLHFIVVELTVCSIPRPHPPLGTNSQGILSGFNKTVLRTLPRSGNLIVVESVLMAVAFLAMLLVRRDGVGRSQRSLGTEAGRKGCHLGTLLAAWARLWLGVLV